MAEKVKEDYLDVDKPIPGQNFVCLSFVSPEKILQKKEQFQFYKYKQNILTEFEQLVETKIKGLLEMVDKETNTINVTDLIKFKDVLDKGVNHYKGTLSEFNEDFIGFIGREEITLNNEFDSDNDFQTSIRTIKVRGVYDTSREAQVRAKVLQRIDPSFDVFVGQVGYWLPWDPETTKMNSEYVNDELNTLMKNYKENEVKRDIFYQDQTRQRKIDAQEQTDRLKEQLSSSNDTNETVDTNQTKKTTQIEKNELSDTFDNLDNLENQGDDKGLEGTKNDFNEPDPWMERKMLPTETMTELN
jgi:hypothetical protein